jgi:hypothetical protein
MRLPAGQAGMVEGGIQALILTIDFVQEMNMKSLFILFLILGFLGTNHYACSQSMTPPKTLTLLYSNNINGEIDPCPT